MPTIISCRLAACMHLAAAAGVRRGISPRTEFTVWRAGADVDDSPAGVSGRRHYADGVPFLGKIHGGQDRIRLLSNVTPTSDTTLTFKMPPALSACPPGTEVCVALAIPVTPGSYPVSVVTREGPSNALTLQVAAR